MDDSVCIVGLGLIGGSLGMALRARGWEVVYVDPNVDERDALARAATRRVTSPAGPLVVLATPVDVAVEHLGAMPRLPDSVVTSVCSVMQPLEQSAGDLRFVAGHPFAGSERSGLPAATPDLFAGRPWFLARSEPAVERMVRAAGAVPEVIEAAEHDRLLALTSHLPQVVSTALASLLADLDPRLVGSGARSLLRLAGSSAEVWQPVLEANRGNVEAAVEALIVKLRNLSPGDFDRANRLTR